MRTITFKDLLWGVARKAGLSPATDGLDVMVAAQITEGINTAIKLAWQYFDWPELCTVVSKTVLIHPTNGARYLPYQTGTFDFGTILAVTNTDPRLGSATHVPYRLESDGFYMPDSGDTVWVRHRVPPPTYTDFTYDSLAHVAGDLVYRPEDGRVYRCLTATNFNALLGVSVIPPAAPPLAQWWEEVPVPAFLAEALKAGGLAAWERTEGQGGTAERIESIMLEWLDHEVDQIHLQQQQPKRWKR